MNERVDNLLAQAYIEFAPDSKAVTARFAELIIRECAELATKEYNNYGGLHGNDLLEHFGVEE